jgi:hypothetical protein
MIRENLKWNKDKHKFQVSFYEFAILSYVALFFIPYLNFPFLLVISCLLILFTLAGQRKIKITWSEHKHDYYLIVLLALTLVWNSIYYISSNSHDGWDCRLHKKIFTLTGDNVSILPANEKGYLLDSALTPYVVNGDAIFETVIRTSRVKEEDSIKASVYCFVSKDFNGHSVKLSVKGAVYGNNVAEFQLFNVRNDGLLLTHNLFNNGDFSDGAKFWIPNADSTIHTIIDTPYGKGIRVSRSDGDGGWWSLRYDGRPIIYNSGHKYQLRFLYKIQKGGELPFKIGWWVDEENGYFASHLPLNIKNLKDGWKQAVCSYRFRQTHSDLPTFLNGMKDFSVVDIANVELRDLNENDTLPSYVDQLSRTGRWELLSLTAPCKNGKVTVSFSIMKKDAKDFSEMTGSVIIVGPEIKRIKKKK